MRSAAERASPAPAWSRALPAIIWLGLAGLILLLFFDSTLVTVDAVMALAWGDEIARGGTPNLTAPLLPVFHPLATAVGAILSPLGTDATIDAFRALSLLGLVALAYAAFRLGRDLAGPFAGGVAAALLLTRPDINEFARLSTIDLTFAALVVLAIALVLERPLGNRWWALGLLTLAGLLRPEAWPIALAYGGWLALRSAGRERVLALVLGLAAPLIWTLSDLVITGGLLTTVREAHGGLYTDLRATGYPLHEAEGGGRSLGYYLDPLTPGLSDVLGRALAAGGVAAAAMALWPLRARETRRELAGLLQGDRGSEPDRSPAMRTLLLAAIAVLALGSVLALRALGFPLSPRFLVLPATLLTVLFAAALVRFAPPTAWRVVVVAVAVALALSLPGALDQISDSRDRWRVSARFLADLRDLTGSSEVEAVLDRCPEWAAGGERIVIVGAAVLSIERDVDATEITVRQRPGGGPPSLLLLWPQQYIGKAGGKLPQRHLVLRSGPWEFWSRCAPQV